MLYKEVFGGSLLRQENDSNNINCHEVITSNEFVDIYHRITIDEDLETVAREVNALCVQNVLKDYALFHIKIPPGTCEDFYFESDFFLLPNLFGLSNTSSLEASGVGPVLQSEALNLSGNGVLIAIIDTGIDYTHQAFIYEDNTTKIISIWDQTIGGNPPEGFLYGTEFSYEQINEALASDEPLSIVPSVDEIGHGTFMAGVSAGRIDRGESFSGAAPDAELVIVKLKQAKQCLKDFMLIKDDAIAYQSNDIYRGLDYVFEKSKKLKKPVAILTALASSDGAHDGTFELEEALAEYGRLNGVATVTSAGNEANTAHHFHGVFGDNENKVDVQLNVAENEKGVFITVWSLLPDIITVELISPSGASTRPIPYKDNVWNTYDLSLETSVVNVHYSVERSEGENVNILIKEPLAGLWTINVYSNVVIHGEFDMYLPIKGFIDDSTVFLSPDPYTTAVIPSTNIGTITVGGYNEIINSLYLPSGRGFTRTNRVKPDIVAPCVNVSGPFPNNTYGTMSGTSIGAALTTGASALLLEWGIVQGNEPFFNTIAIKNRLARGARRRKGVIYPNREWGYGELDLMNTFMLL